MCRRATGCTLACLVLVGCGGTESTAIDGGQTPECLANAPNEYRVTILGVGFAAMEGVPVYAATEMGLAFAQATCRAAGSAQVRDAGFELRLTNLTDDAAYPLVGAFIDLDRDGRCDAAVDSVWGIIGGVAPNGKMEVQLTPTDFSGTDDPPDVCDRFSSRATSAP